MARGEMLKDRRQEHWSGLRESAATAAAVALPVGKSVQLSASYQDAIKDIAITGDLAPAAEAALGQSVRAAALRFNQSQFEIAKGVGILIAEGMSPDKASSQIGLLAKFTTATRAAMADAARMNVAFDQLGVKDKELAFNQATKAGKQGSFEIRDMAKWFPDLGGMMKSIGVEGNEAVVNMASRLQIARRTAGNNDEAANNFKNFLSKLTSPDTLNDFAKVNIDLQGSLLRLARQGLDPVEGAVGAIMDKMRQSSPQAVKELEKLSAELAAIKDPTERAAEMARRRTMIEAIGNRAGLSSMFQDMQAMSYLLAEVQNRSDLKKIQEEVKTGKGKSGKSQIDEDFAKRMQGASEQFKQLKIGLTDIGITIGDALLPSLVSVVDAIKPGVKAFGDWAKQNPGLLKGIIGVVGGLTLLRTAMFSLKLLGNLMFLAPSNSIFTRWMSLTSRITTLRALLAGGMPRLPLALPSVATSGIANLAPRLLAGFQAVLPWIGRAGMMLLRLSPIGLVLSTVGLVVYKYWKPIKGFFVGLWQGLSSVAGPAIKSLIQSVIGFGTSIGRLLLSIPGVGFAFRAISTVAAPLFSMLVNGVKAVWNWFANLLEPVDDVGGKAQNMGQKVGVVLGGIVKGLIDLPTKFIKLGTDLVDGLVNGIRTRIGSAVQVVEELGNSAIGKFKSALGIKSPSRVFMGFGDNIAQGAAIGVARTAGVVATATAGMALATTTAWGKPTLPPPAVGKRPAITQQAQLAAAVQAGAGASAPSVPSRIASTAAAGNVTVNLYQTFHIDGGGKNVKEQIQQATQLTVRELEKMMEQVYARQQRRAFS
ncbi:phage tail tape measure protein [Chromobacterium violaceum]|nr:phage tail tape measure protein [Chromobacterium violaceum]